jgi:hypothetical protein
VADPRPWAPGWSPPPGPPGNAPPKRRVRPVAVLLGVLGSLLLVSLLIAVAIPIFVTARTGPGSGASSLGTGTGGLGSGGLPSATSGWFQGGIPASWVPTTVNNDAVNSVLEGAWQTPGPTVDGFYPCVYLVQLSQSANPGLSTGGWLGMQDSLAESRGWLARDIVLADGAPALSVYISWGLGTDQSSKHVAISEYRIYATRGDDPYLIVFMTEVDSYASEQPRVSAVMDKFVGNATGATTTPAPPARTPE